MMTFHAPLFAGLAFALSFCGCGLVLLIGRRYRVGQDSSAGVQRLHSGSVPRLGGVPVGLTFGIVVILAVVLEPALRSSGALLLLVVLPTFVAGVAEDITQRVGVRLRLLVTMASAGLGIWLLGAVLNRLSIPGVDGFLATHFVAAVLLTLIAGAGVPHAFNIVDGCNGLSSSAGIIAFIGLGALAWSLNDSFIATMSLIAACSAFGFLLWNFPFGKIFLGDGGAYSMGVLIAELSILLIVRHPQVSAWFALLLVIHPVVEVLYSCARRGRHRLGQMFEPDARHLHQLIYRRLFAHLFDTGNAHQQALASGLTSAMFCAWYLALLGLALTFWDNSLALVLCVLGFILVYILSYRWLACRRRTPVQALLRRAGAPAAGREKVMGSVPAQSARVGLGHDRP